MSKTKVIISIVAVVIVTGITFGVLYLVSYMNDKSVTDFASCVAKNNVILETYPRQCKTKSGKTFTEDISTSGYEYTSDNGVVIKLKNIIAGQTIYSPLVIEGEVPGSWSFEASFPIEIQDENGNTISTGTASLSGDWMTDDYVEFSANLEFNIGVSGTGKIIIKKDNPSGLESNDDSVEIPVNFT